MTIEENSISGTHSAGPTASFSVTTTTDGSLKNTIRQRLVVVACWRLNNAVFEFDSSFVGPTIAPELAQLAGVFGANPDCPMSVFGHADPTGDDAYNKQLSGRRARAVYGLVTRDVAMWEDLFSKSFGNDVWGLRSTQKILQTLKDANGAPFYEGEIDGRFGDLTDRAIRGFQNENGLPVDGVAGPGTRAKMYSAYMDFLAGTLTIPKTSFLDRGEDPDARRACQGCSEFNPIRLLPAADQGPQHAKDPLRDERNASNRRVMIFFFREGTVVSAGDWPCPSTKDGPSKCLAQFWPDGETRRTPTAVERNYPKDRHTMACRFYDHFARVSPCEGIRPIGIAEFDSDLVVAAGDSDASDADGPDDRELNVRRTDRLLGPV